MDLLYIFAAVVLAFGGYWVFEWVTRPPRYGRPSDLSYDPIRLRKAKLRRRRRQMCWVALGGAGLGLLVWVASWAGWF